METLERIQKSGLVPVVAFESAEQAIPASRALLDARLDVIEITLRTEAGLEAIRRVKTAFPEMLVGAGTVLTRDKAQEAVAAGAAFVVSPGYDDEIVAWCLENGVTVLPGCVTPSEIQAALRRGLRVLKFFPADVYGGVRAMKALNGPFASAGVRFVPTGGVDGKNLADFVREPFIAAVGGGWLCSAKQLKAGDYAGITRNAAEAIDILLGFEFSRAEPAGDIQTHSVARAAYYFGKRGFHAEPAAADPNGAGPALCLRDPVGGGAVRLLQR